MPEKIVQLNEEVIKGQLKELVRGSVEETLNELLRFQRRFVKTNFGVRCMHLAVEVFQQTVLQKQQRHRYMQTADQLLFPAVVQAFQHFEFIQNGSRIIIQLLSRGGGNHTATGALQQLAVHLLFHGANGTAQTRLSHQQFLRRSADAAAIHHSHKVFQISSLHYKFPFPGPLGEGGVFRPFFSPS